MLLAAGFRQGSAGRGRLHFVKVARSGSGKVVGKPGLSDLCFRCGALSTVISCQ